jgi:hypothetical protein
MKTYSNHCIGSLSNSLPYDVVVYIINLASISCELVCLSQRVLLLTFLRVLLNLVSQSMSLC